MIRCAVAGERQAVGHGVRQVVGEGPGLARPEVEHPDGGVRVPRERAVEGEGDALAVRGDRQQPADRIAPQDPPPPRVPDDRLPLRGGGDQRAVRREADVGLPRRLRVRSLPDGPPAAGVEQRQALAGG